MEQENKQINGTEERKELTIKFGKGLVGDVFRGKDGVDYRQISIPNKDPEDKSPWASFVVRATGVHDDKFGKGMWIKVPADGTTTIMKRQLAGQDQTGKNEYTSTKEKVSNVDLKRMVEFYKERNREERTEGADSPKEGRAEKDSPSEPCEKKSLSEKVTIKKEEAKIAAQDKPLKITMGKGKARA